MIGLGLRQLQDALNRKADFIQREFVAASDRLQVVGKLLMEGRPEDREKHRAEQLALRERQQVLAEEINLWRERARGVVGQRGGEALRDYVKKFLTYEENDIRAAAEHALYVMDASEEELARLLEETRRLHRERFGTAEALISYAGLAPGHLRSGGVRR